MRLIKKLGGYFTFNEKVIWYKTKDQITLFLNQELKIPEKQKLLQWKDTIVFLGIFYQD